MKQPAPEGTYSLPIELGTYDNIPLDIEKGDDGNVALVVGLYTENVHIKMSHKELKKFIKALKRAAELTED